jgi:hypothetical protein
VRFCDEKIDRGFAQNKFYFRVKAAVIFAEAAFPNVALQDLTSMFPSSDSLRIIFLKLKFIA